MADDWIMMRHDLRDDPATLCIAHVTGLEIDHVVGKLHRVWSWVDRHSTDGAIAGQNADVVSEVAAHDKFAEAMMGTSPPWLEQNAHGIVFPKFSQYTDTAKKRAKEAKRKRNTRRKNVRKTSAKRPRRGGKSRTNFTTTGQDRTGQNRTEQDSTNPAAAAAAAASGETMSKSQKIDRLKRLGLRTKAAEEVAEHPNCTPEQIEVAASNAKILKAKSEIKKSVPAYIRSAIIDNYEAIDGAASWTHEDEHAEGGTRGRRVAPRDDRVVSGAKTPKAHTRDSDGRIDTDDQT